MTLRAAAFIVTVYGDVVVPRGGEAWIGNIIAACAMVGISETLVRTAVSRLVAAGQLEGRREGRRSYYRLTAPAMAEFDAAARLIYGAAPEPGWRFAWVPDGDGESSPEVLMAQLERRGFSRLKPQLAVGTDSAPLPAGVLAFAAVPEGEVSALNRFAAAHFDLPAHAAAYDDFIRRFAPFADPAACPADGDAALALRLLLVHDFRRALLRDPRLPRAALPADWPGHAAARLFAKAYLALSGLADAHATSVFEGAEGGLTADVAVIQARRAGLVARGAAAAAAFT
ncbi:MAG: PaaX family transcriptional regulator [Pararhodobacter sp.]|nr:PaaX family transcriptional regulator [Pararhodobacter sp.]